MTGIPGESRVRGCLLGGAIGDALGAPVEFMDLDSIVKRFEPGGVDHFAPAYGGAPGSITDDTQLTLFTVDGIIRMLEAAGDGPLDSSIVHEAYRRWYRTQTEPYPDSLGDDDGWLLREPWLWNRRAPGMTCIDALSRATEAGLPATNDSKGCGTVMRSAPFGFLRERRMELAQECSAFTHGHPTAGVSAAVLAETIGRVTEGADLAGAIESAVASAEELFTDTHEETTDIVRRAVELASQGPPSPDVVGYLGQGWIAEEALAISILVALTATDWIDALRRAVTHSGDSDSTGAITGNLLGAWWGDDDLPADLLNDLEGRAVIERLAGELAGTVAHRSGS